MSHSVEDLLEGVKRGDSESMGILGECCLYGNKGLEINYEKAFELSERAAKAGYIRAYTNLGILYMNGYFVERNEDRAMKYFLKAMEGGDMKAPRHLGIYYRNKKDVEKAFEYFRIGAEKGDITSLYYLGEAYEKGTGVRKDIEKAIEYYKKSAARGDRISEPAIKALERLLG